MISTHVLDAALGRPAAGVAVELERPDGTRSAAVTDDDGRVTQFAGGGAGVHRLHFATAAYFAATGQTGFYPEVTVAFRLDPGREHHHVPLLLSPYAYSTYRGS
jgi:5-hydroxyisourate hydrolase